MTDIDIDRFPATGFFATEKFLPEKDRWLVLIAHRSGPDIEVVDIETFMEGHDEARKFWTEEALRKWNSN